jgi:hypothetical protein
MHADRGSTEALDHLAARWTRLGAGYAGDDDLPTPDIERLIVDTAQLGPADPRTFTLAVTWLSRYASLVAEHRLEGFADELDPADQSRLGLLLDLSLTHARRHDRRRNLERAMSRCIPSAQPAPFFDAARASAVLARRAERMASPVSQRWNLWLQPIEPKYDALRPVSWIIGNNPALAFRADFRGDLRTSILIALRGDPDAGASIVELSRRCGASRTAILAALEDLELGRHVTRRRAGKSSRIELAA